MSRFFPEKPCLIMPVSHENRGTVFCTAAVYDSDKKFVDLYSFPNEYVSDNITACNMQALTYAINRINYPKRYPLKITIVTDDLLTAKCTNTLIYPGVAKKSAMYELLKPLRRRFRDACKLCHTINGAFYAERPIEFLNIWEPKLTRSVLLKRWNKYLESRAIK